MDGALTQPAGRVAPGQPYGRVAKWFHWLTALLIAVALPVGFVIDHIKDDDKMPFYALHESAGVTLFVVVVLRLVWRWRFPPPPLDARIPRPMRAAAAGVHHALYALLLLQPVIGFFMTNAFGFPLQGDTAYLGVIDFPKFMEPVEWLAGLLKSVHMVFGWLILVLVVVHVGAVVLHQALRRDDTLLRMI